MIKVSSSAREKVAVLMQEEGLILKAPLYALG